MSEINLNKKEDFGNYSSSSSSLNKNDKSPNYFMSFLAGLGTSVVVAIVLAVIGMAVGSEFFILLCIGAVVVGVVIREFVPKQSLGGAIIGAILTPATYFLYQLIMAFNGYFYEKDGESTFWILLIGSVLYGAYMGYNNDDD